MTESYSEWAKRFDRPTEWLAQDADSRELCERLYALAGEVAEVACVAAVYERCEDDMLYFANRISQMLNLSWNQLSQDATTMAVGLTTGVGIDPLKLIADLMSTTAQIYHNSSWPGKRSFYEQACQSPFRDILSDSLVKALAYIFVNNHLNLAQLLQYS